MHITKSTSRGPLLEQIRIDLFSENINIKFRSILMTKVMQINTILLNIFIIKIELLTQTTFFHTGRSLNK